MKLPKSLIICGKTFKIKNSSKHNGGKFSCSKQTIEVGTKGGKEDVGRVLTHEVLEVILAERNHRYCKEYAYSENGDYVFMFNHPEYENVAQDLAYVLRQIYGL